MHVERTRARLVAGLGSIVTLFFLMLAVDGLADGADGHHRRALAAGCGDGRPRRLDCLRQQQHRDAWSPRRSPRSGALRATASSSPARQAVPARSPIRPRLAFGTGSLPWAPGRNPTGSRPCGSSTSGTGPTGWLLDIKRRRRRRATRRRACVLYLKATPGPLRTTPWPTAASSNLIWKHVRRGGRSAQPEGLSLLSTACRSGTKDITSLGTASLLANTGPLQIGTYSTTGPFFNGMIDEPIIYSQVLTAGADQDPRGGAPGASPPRPTRSTRSP
jgi:hypothetical protein